FESQVLWANQDLQASRPQVSTPLAQVQGCRRPPAQAARCLHQIPLAISLYRRDDPGQRRADNALHGSDAAWAKWLQQGLASVAHPIGTAAMMRRSLGDAQLTVYGTANVHVVDTSVVPLQISATLYGVAEKAVSPLIPMLCKYS
ncbi:hypothetical protein GGX14DRAFT_476268, partial [Mycena pura]